MNRKPPRRPQLLGDIPQESRAERSGEIVGGMSSFNSQGGSNEPQYTRPEMILNTTTFVSIGYEVGTDSQEVLIANRMRNYLLIQNRSAGAIEVAFGNKADGWNSVEVASGGNYEPWVVPNNSVNISGSAANSQVVIVEGTGTRIK